MNVLECARYVIDLNTFSILENQNWYINVVAIHGDGEVLCEVGIGKTRPYRSGIVPRLYHGPVKSFTDRKKILSLSEHQYVSVRRALFSVLQGIVNSKVSAWECGPHNPFIVRGQKNYYTIRGKKVSEGTRWRERKLETYFSVDRRDVYLLRDVYHSEIYLNLLTRRHLRGLSRFIDKRLSVYPKAYYRGFAKLKGVRDVVSNIRGQGIHKKPYLLSLLNGSKYAWWNDIAPLVGVDPEIIYPQVVEARNALPPIADIPSGVSVRREHTNYVVFGLEYKA